MRRCAFTLVELLVVISILMLLVALLFVVSARSRQYAQTIACRANIHGLLLSLQAYDSEQQSLPYGYDFKNHITPPGGYGVTTGDAGIDQVGWWWFHSTGVVCDKSSERRKMLRCPSKRLDDPRYQADLLCGNYGVNRALCKVSPSFSRPLYKKDFVGSPLSLSRLPGSTLLLMDSGYSLICWWNATTDPPVKFDPSYIEDTSYVPGLEINQCKALRPAQWTDAVAGRHPNQIVNIGFADGHADPMPVRDLLVEKAEKCEYTNTRLWLGQ